MFYTKYHDTDLKRRNLSRDEEKYPRLGILCRKEIQFLIYSGRKFL